MSSYSSWTRKEPTPEPGRQGPRVGSWCLQPTRTHTGPLRPQLSSPASPPPTCRSPFTPAHRVGSARSPVPVWPTGTPGHPSGWGSLSSLPASPQQSGAPTAPPPLWVESQPRPRATKAVFTLALCRTGSHPCSCSSCLVALTPLLYLVEGVDGTQPCTRPSAWLGPAPTPHRAWLCPASPCIPAWAHEAAAPAHRLVSVRPAHAPAPKPSREEGPRPTPAPSAAPLAPNWTLRIEPSVSPRPAHWRWQRGTLPQIPQT